MTKQTHFFANNSQLDTYTLLNIEYLDRLEIDIWQIQIKQS